MKIYIDKWKVLDVCDGYSWNRSALLW